ncbi:MAG: response regulator [Halobacteriovoraceae bacterium]|nr:response regulator [Halobacteriovoraceae bacterium]
MQSRVLIVEDEKDIIEVLSIYAQDFFEIIDSAVNVSDGIEKIKENSYDCIVLDISLGSNENGAQILKFLIENQDNPNYLAPIVISSGHVNENFIKKYTKRFAGILKKPYDEKTFKSIISLAITPVEEVIENYESNDEVPLVNTSLPFTQPELNVMVDDILKRISKNPELKKMLKTIKIERNADKYIPSHVGLIINISTAISKKLDWNTKSALEKFVIAAYLHDYAIDSRPDLARIQSSDQLELMKKANSNEEIQAVREHPFVVASLLEKFQDLSQDVLTLIRQHHERPDGSGFPKGIHHSRINPFSALFIISHDLATYIINNKEWSLDEFLKLNGEEYMGANFKKIIRAIEELSK